MAAKILRFGDFELDRGAYQLRLKGEPLALERIPFDLLFLLIEHGAESRGVTQHQPFMAAASELQAERKSAAEEREHEGSEGS